MEHAYAGPDFQPGQVISFHYPKSNQVDNRRPVYSHRTVFVTEVRDVCQGGLSPVTIRKRPYLARGRWLITGVCLDSGQERSFYLESMQERQRQTWYTLGLFDPLEHEQAGPEMTTGRYAPTRSGRDFMAAVIENYNGTNCPDNCYAVGVFPIDD